MKKSVRVSEKLVSPCLPGLQVPTHLIRFHAHFMDMKLDLSEYIYRSTGYLIERSSLSLIQEPISNAVPSLTFYIFLITLKTFVGEAGKTGFHYIRAPGGAWGGGCGGDCVRTTRDDHHPHWQGATQQTQSDTRQVRSCVQVLNIGRSCWVNVVSVLLIHLKHNSINSKRHSSSKIMCTGVKHRSVLLG